MRYTMTSYARTVSGLIVQIPTDVCQAQKHYALADKSFPAIHRDGRPARARLAPERYGLFTPGTGDIVVRIV